MKQINVIDSKKAAQWKYYLAMLPKQSIHIQFLPEYHNLFISNVETSAEIFICREDENILVIPYIKEGINKIGTKLLDKKYYHVKSVFGYTGPLTNSKDDAFVYYAFKEYAAYLSDQNVLFDFIRFNPIIENYKILKSINTHYDIFPEKKYIYVDLLLDYDLIKRNYRKRYKTLINKYDKFSQNYNYVITNNDYDLYNRFVRLYIAHMKSLGANDYYLFNDDYYIKLYGLINNGLGCIFAVTENAELISALVFLYNEHTVYYHHGCHNVALDPAGILNKYLFDRAVSYFKQQNFTYLMLGGGVSNNDEDSLYQFKLGFSKFWKYFYLGKQIFNNDKYNELCKIWAHEYPELKIKYKHYIDKYLYSS